MKNQEQEETRSATVSIPFSGKLGVFVAIALGLLLLLIGYDTGTGGLVATGMFILPLALIWGGLFLTREGGPIPIPIRVALLICGGLIILVIIAGGGLASLYGGW